METKRLGAKSIQKIESHDFTKRLRRYEFEIKFDITDLNIGSFEMLKRIRAVILRNKNYTLCKIARGDRLVTSVLFFLDKKRVEYSVFKYRNASMVKVKKHKIVDYQNWKIFKNEESLVIDVEDFDKKLDREKVRFKRHSYRLENLEEYLKKRESGFAFVGNMKKERLKDFVFDHSNGFIYSFAVTYCSTEGRVQRQFEIEYAGYLDGLEAVNGGLENGIKEGLIGVGGFMYRNMKDILKPSVERKFDFVLNN